MKTVEFNFEVVYTAVIIITVIIIELIRRDQRKGFTETTTRFVKQRGESCNVTR